MGSPFDNMPRVRRRQDELDGGIPPGAGSAVFDNMPRVRADAGAPPPRRRPRDAGLAPSVAPGAAPETSRGPAALEDMPRTRDPQTGAPSSTPAPVAEQDVLDTLLDYGAAITQGVTQNYGDDIARLVGGDGQVLEDAARRHPVAHGIGQAGVGVAAAMAAAPYLGAATASRPLWGPVLNRLGQSTIQGALGAASEYGDSWDPRKATGQGILSGIAAYGGQLIGEAGVAAGSAARNLFRGAPKTASQAMDDSLVAIEKQADEAPRMPRTPEPEVELTTPKGASTQFVDDAAPMGPPSEQELLARLGRELDAMPKGASNGPKTLNPDAVYPAGYDPTGQGPRALPPQGGIVDIDPSEARLLPPDPPPPSAQTPPPMLTPSGRPFDPRLGSAPPSLFPEQPPLGRLGAPPPGPSPEPSPFPEQPPPSTPTIPASPPPPPSMFPEQPPPTEVASGPVPRARDANGKLRYVDPRERLWRRDAPEPGPGEPPAPLPVDEPPVAPPGDPLDTLLSARPRDGAPLPVGEPPVPPRDPLDTVAYARPRVSEPPAPIGEPPPVPRDPLDSLLYSRERATQPLTSEAPPPPELEPITGQGRMRMGDNFSLAPPPAPPAAQSPPGLVWKGMRALTYPLGKYGAAARAGMDAVRPALGPPLSPEQRALGGALGEAAWEVGAPAVFGRKVNAQGEEMPAYAGPATTNYALSAVVSSGASGLSKDEESAMTAALVSGDDKKIRAADYKLRMSNPAYARAVERELRSYQEEGGY